MKIINIKSEHPPVDVAITHVLDEINKMQFSGQKLLKIIHGYGSSGKGGIIKKELKKELQNLKIHRKIRDYIIGEQLTTLTIESKKFDPIITDELMSDFDFMNINPGITIIVL